MTITLRGDDFAVEQMAKQLYRLIDVLKVQDLPADQLVEHELALIKVRATDPNRAEVLKIIELYKGRILDIAPETVIVEHTGTEQEIDSLVALLGGFGIRELVRTGTWLPGSVHRLARSCAPAPCRPPAAVNARRGPSDARTHVLRQRRRPVGARRPDRRGHRLRQPGPRPRAEPARQRASTSSSAWRRAPRAGPLAEAAGLRVADVADAVKAADVIMIAVPDTVQKAVYDARDRAQPARRASC